jgi:hypothetical protein
MAPGDGVLVWKSGDKAGIYAIASEWLESVLTVSEGRLSPRCPVLAYHFATSKKYPVTMI